MKREDIARIFEGATEAQITEILNLHSADIGSAKAGTAQQITVKGWDSFTHNIVYNATAREMKAFTDYRTAASPTEAQAKAAQQSVFKAAKLA